MKTINELIEVIQYLFIIIIAGASVLFIELMIIPYFDSIFLAYLIRLLVVVVLYFIGKFLKQNIFIIFILFYVSMTAYILLFSNMEDKQVAGKKKYSIQSKPIFQTKEQKTKYANGTIKEKIIILRDMNLSKKQIYKKLENDMQFRELIKNDDKEVEMILNSK